MRLKLLLIFFINSTYVRADVILDSTLGHSGSLQGPNFVIEAKFGQQHGGNLFHSFQQFDIRQGESVTFSGPSTVNNIISRVTGGTESTINGLLRSTIPDANFYIINPASVIFNEHAQLDVQGAFYVSTADYLRFSDGGQFNAIQPNKSLLTVAPPAAFGFLAPTYAPVTVHGSELKIPDTQTLSITAGDINLTQAGLYAPAGHIHLVSVASAGEININVSADIQLNTFAKLGQIMLSQTTLGNDMNSFNGAKNVYIIGNQFFSKGSIINAQTLQENQIASSHDITISMRDTVTLERGENGKVTEILTDSPRNADAGPITIKTDELKILDGTVISTDTKRGGAAGKVTIEANQLIMINASITTDTSNNGGPAGNILIIAKSFDIHERSQLKATTRGTEQPAGQITIKVDHLQMFDDATINTGTFSDGIGKGGQIVIEAETLVMTDRAWIISNSFNRGDSGSLHINVGNLILSQNSVIATTTFSEGKGGEVKIQARDTFSLNDNAVIISGTEGKGSGGNIALVIQADKVTIADATNISSASGQQNTFIEEIAKLITVAQQRGAKINDNVFVGGGKAGTVHIKSGHFYLENTKKHWDEKLQLKNCEYPTISNFILRKRPGLSKALQ